LNRSNMSKLRNTTSSVLVHDVIHNRNDRSQAKSIQNSRPFLSSLLLIGGMEISPEYAQGRRLYFPSVIRSLLSSDIIGVAQDPPVASHSLGRLIPIAAYLATPISVAWLKHDGCCPLQRFLKGRFCRYRGMGPKQTLVADNIRKASIAASFHTIQPKHLSLLPRCHSG
jgi:hypothetical protein